jgi:hypothetical protein
MHVKERFAMAPRKKALVLSGGGGRGAYHIGVLDALVQSGWMEDGKGPDIIAGTSIGAINAAALASGRTVAELKRRWLAMNTENVHRLSSDLPAYMRPMLRFFLRSVLTSEGGPANEALDELPEGEKLSARGMFERLGSFARATPFRSLLDTGPPAPGAAPSAPGWTSSASTAPVRHQLCWPPPSSRPARCACSATTASTASPATASTSTT